ncbi:unnamed protein product [Chondrus crispus]|uniref:Uncharacterized protein n=1 Tax=Chondrus crispus TaxID=2769 RepID=R7QJL9_CHOCR|nr:unnamed protein product [Chondrus crispus]CDF37600.1 unnamed protein product [Chondrus crispus]|eukprot:XP_005717471.1 unnamed protein product [Chondrus crispus]
MQMHESPAGHVIMFPFVQNLPSVQPEEHVQADPVIPSPLPPCESASSFAGVSSGVPELSISAMGMSAAFAVSSEKHTVLSPICTHTSPAVEQSALDVHASSPPEGTHMQVSPEEHVSMFSMSVQLLPPAHSDELVQIAPVIPSPLPPLEPGSSVVSTPTIGKSEAVAVSSEKHTVPPPSCTHTSPAVEQSAPDIHTSSPSEGKHMQVSPAEQVSMSPFVQILPSAHSVEFVQIDPVSPSPLPPFDSASSVAGDSLGEESG